MEPAVKAGIEKTLNQLKDTANEAAVPVLLNALDSAQPEIQEGALRALLARRSGSGQREIIRRWNSLSEAWKSIVANNPRRIATAVRDSILSTDDELCAYGCDALLNIREYDLMPALITAVEDPSNPQAPRVARTLVEMAELMYADINGPRKHEGHQDPARLRHHVLASLQHSVDRFDQHRHRELVETFLLLTTRENPLLKRILRDPHHSSYLVVMEILNQSARTGIVRLILNFLQDRFAPSAVLQVIARRRDPVFLRHALKRVGANPDSVARTNLRRIESIGWLRHDLSMLDTLTDSEQQAAIQMAICSGHNRLEVFDVLKYVLQNGKVPGRQTAAQALATFGGADANQLVLEGLEDPDPQVQAQMVAQLREKGIPGAISRLIQLIDSPHEVVRSAAQKSLTEFNFARYLSLFDTLDDDVRRSTGLLVRRIDPEAPALLASELKSKTRTRRLRGLEVAQAMDAVDFVEPLIIGLLSDEDHFVRAEAARALVHCKSPLAREALRSALVDRSVSVREAAELALREVGVDQTRDTIPATLSAALRHAEENPMMNETDIV
jgi:HEAT repeat protein